MDVSSLFRLMLSLLTLLLSPGIAWFRGDLLPLHKSAEDNFDWDKIQPASELKIWHKCYTGFECAKLEVPLDWNNVKNPNKVVLAISRLPAKVDRTDESYGGPIILNPGGPGGSGVDFLLWGGKAIQTKLDGDKHFDILSFDPRGVHHTTPSSACFNSSLSRQLYDLKINSQGTIDISDGAFNSKWAAVQSFAKICIDSGTGRYPDGSNIRQFASTAMVAYDMLAIIDKIEEAREEPRRGNPLDIRHKADSHGPALLQYWVYSYGTVLGNTFASMFPDRIGRLVLDGVVDAPDYIATGWLTNLQDSMKTWVSFSQFCYEGKRNCPLNDQNVKSSQDIETKVNKLLDRLKDNPMPTAYDGMAQIITYSDVRLNIFQSLYFPGEEFPKLARVLTDLINGNTSSMAPLLSRIKLDDDKRPEPPPDLPPSEKKNNSWDRPLPPAYAHTMEASKTVLCGDGDSIQNRTKAHHRAYVDLLVSQSPIAAGQWSEITLPCLGWADSLRPQERNRFTGPFGSKLYDLDTRGKPILWISNTADPVTPLRNAYKMAETHEGSVVLVLDAPGHASSPANPSQCVYEAARKYFNEGILPKEGIVCKSDFIPWQDY